MSVKLDHVVPFGRLFDEYQKMFDLTKQIGSVKENSRRRGWSDGF